MKYRVLLRGENFEITFEGKIQNVGFYTTRYVKATSIEQAELKAVELIQCDPELQSMMVPNSSYIPMVFAEKMYKARWWKRLGGKGYSFYLMDETSDDV